MVPVATDQQYIQPFPVYPVIFPLGGIVWVAAILPFGDAVLEYLHEELVR